MAGPFAAERWSVAGGDPLVVVHGAGAEELPAPGTLPAVVVAVGPEHDTPGWADVSLPADHADLAHIADTVGRSPIAATALALLLRAAPGSTVGGALVAESTTYSMLQAGPEFLRWRAERPRKPPPEELGPVVLTHRDGDVLAVELNRPARHNALSARLRDELCEALDVALADATVRVRLSGRGPSFSAGGDLDEFGSFPDPATAHGIRLTRSPAWRCARLADRLTVRLHGACLGAGVELSAFAGRVICHPDARLGLPEVPLGLVPGAGGTVSLPRRIGRHRTALLALTGRPIGAETALAWGLVDDVR